jgi:hypothetical protein
MGVKNSQGAVLYRYGKIVNVMSEFSKKKTTPVFQHFELTKAGSEFVTQGDEFEGYLVDVKVEEYVWENKKKKSIVMFFVDEDRGPLWKVNMNPNTMTMGLINTLCNDVFKDKMSSMKLYFQLWEGKPNEKYDRYSSNCTVRLAPKGEPVKRAYDNNKIKEKAPIKEFVINGEKVFDSSEFYEYHFKLIENVIKPRLDINDSPRFTASPQKQEDGHSFVDNSPAPPTGSSFEERTAEYESSMAKPSAPAAFTPDEDDDLPF